jgi:prevent-host-death family protein
MKNMVATQVRRSWSRTLGRVEHGGQVILITRNGRAAAVLMPCAGLDMIQALDDAVDVSAARKALMRRRNVRRTTWNEIKRRYGIYA